MKKLALALVLATTLTVGTMPAMAVAPKPGAACSTAGKTVVQGRTTLKCTKSGKTLKWVAQKPQVTGTGGSSQGSSSGGGTTSGGTAQGGTTQGGGTAGSDAIEPKPNTDTFTPATHSENADAAWVKAGWTRPTSAESVTAAATKSFTNYVATTRFPNDKVEIFAESGADSALVDWVTKGATLVATTFEKPASLPVFNDVIAVSRDYLVSTFTKLYDGGYANAQAGAWDSGNPAWGGRTSNAWSMANIIKNNGMTNDRAGMAQTAGHEYFHAIQENFVNASGTNCGSCGFPQWFWEGPAMFVGLETSAALGFDPYAHGRSVMLDRVNPGPTGKLSLKQVDVNTPPSVDPYGIGEIATEFLVANVGMSKFIDIYRWAGKGKSFEESFERATNVPLADFYLMFEDARATLGAPKQQ